MWEITNDLTWKSESWKYKKSNSTVIATLVAREGEKKEASQHTLLLDGTAAQGFVIRQIDFDQKFTIWWWFEFSCKT